MLRPGRDDDAAGIIRLIGDCWAEYPGCVMDVDGENPELRSLASYFAARGGALWVVDGADGLVGMVGVKHLGGDDWELCRMYVAAASRGTGLADQLMAAVIAFVRAHGGRRLELWTDTRFTRAHRFYERHGFTRSEGVRELFDLSETVEYGYSREV
jgi:GNAT superfamily N-acetyltransferase